MDIYLEECLELSGVVDDYYRGCSKFLIHMSVDCCSEGAEFLVKLVIEVFHNLNEVVFGDEWLVTLFIAWILSAIVFL